MIYRKTVVLNSRMVFLFVKNDPDTVNVIQKFLVVI